MTITIADCRLLVDPPAAGEWNMAVDEVLLESAAQDRVCTLRFYRWSAPTLSLGYFQNWAARAAHAGSRECAVVRRASGGGAIVHDAELTYSLATPLAHPSAADARGLYDAVHQSLVKVLAAWDIAAGLCDRPADGRLKEQPFLCFQRLACGDVVVGGAKVCGSAQRRRRGAVAQHGSVLLVTSPAAPELAGLKELTGVRLDPEELARAWQAAIQDRLGLTFAHCVLAFREEEQAASLATGKYAAEQWTRRR